MPHGQAAAAPQSPVMRDLVLPMWRQEQRIIEDAIQSFAGNIALAAAALELSPSTIYRKRQAWAEMELKRA
jgi:two-component system repressor protein LuxO